MPASSAADILAFGTFRFERRRRILARRDGSGVFAPLAIGGRALAVLDILVERPGELVTRAEIIEAVWPGAAVEDGNLNVQIAALRRALDEGRTDGSVIETFPGSGYRFAAPVRRVAAEAAAPPLPEKPSLAVMPFQNMSLDPEEDYFADGMVEEIITALSRIRWLFVIARSSSFTYKGHAIDARRVGRELGVRYIVEGAVRRAGGGVRISVQLIDAQSGAHLWADRFDGGLADVFDLQDKVASSIAGVIEPTLQAAEVARSANRPTIDLTAYDLYLRAYEMFLASATLIPEALRLLERAIARDPGYGPALAWAAVCCLRLFLDRSGADPAADRKNGADYARRALAAAPDDPVVLANAALVLGDGGGDGGVMRTLVDRALALNPSFARGWYIGAILRMREGRFDQAIEFAEASLRLSPHGRFGQVYTVIGASLLFSRRFDEALPKLLLAVQDDPSFPMPWRYLAICHARMGRIDEAREVAAKLRAMTPLVVANDHIFVRAEDREFYLSGLRLAAGEAP